MTCATRPLAHRAAAIGICLPGLSAAARATALPSHGLPATPRRHTVAPAVSGDGDRDPSAVVVRAAAGEPREDDVPVTGFNSGNLQGLGSTAINGPRGSMAVVDRASPATLLRLEPPGPAGTPCASNPIGQGIRATHDATARSGSAGRLPIQGGLLERPLIPVRVPNGHLIAANGLNGPAVELDPANDHELYAQWIDPVRAQAGSADLFGIVMTPSRDGLYYAQDEIHAAGSGRSRRVR